MNSSPIYKKTYMKDSIPLNNKGLPHGYCIKYNNGIRWSGYCINGKMNGPWEVNLISHVRKRPNVIVKIMGDFKNDEKYGLWKQYSDEHEPYLQLERKIFYIN